MGNQNQNQQHAELMVQQQNKAMEQAVQAKLQAGLIRVDAEGKYRRVAQYESYSSVKAETREEKIKLFNIVNGTDETVMQLKSVIGKEIVIKDVIHSPYNGTDETNGEDQNGVITVMFDEEGNTYATSSKSVYFTLQNAYKVFGKPDDVNYEPLTFKVYEERKANSRNKSVDLRLIG